MSSVPLGLAGDMLGGKLTNSSGSKWTGEEELFLSIKNLTLLYSLKFINAVCWGKTKQQATKGMAERVKELLPPHPKL